MHTHPDRDLGCFDRPPDWPLAVWQACSLSCQALIVSLDGELSSLQVPADDPARRLPTASADMPAWLVAARRAIAARPKPKGQYRDDSRFTGDEDYSHLSRAEVTRFYREQNPEGLPIDIDGARVQIECFGWRDASFRVDVHFDKKPSFTPLNTSFTRAHRLHMRRSGVVIKSDPIYRSTNLQPGVDEAALPPTSRGFFPGHAAFQAQLDGIDRALRTVGRVPLLSSQSSLQSSSQASSQASFATPGAGSLRAWIARVLSRPSTPVPVAPAVAVHGGLSDLQRYQADIVETDSTYRVTLDADRAGLSTTFGPSTFLIFEIEKDGGRVSPLSVKPYTPPALQ